MYSSVLSATISGVEGVPVLVEADVSNGLPVFSMVGYLSSRVREAQERVWTALRNTGLSFPPKRITVNLSPADIRKEGTRFDLPIAAALLGAFGYLDKEKLQGVCMAGELGLNGEMKGVRGILPIVDTAVKNGCRLCIIPQKNLSETKEFQGIPILGVDSLGEFLELAKLENWGIPKQCKKEESTGEIQENEGEGAGVQTERSEEYQEDFADILGQEAAKRAAVIAAAGFHNILFIGTKGAGKTMIAARLPTLFPPLDREDSMELSRIYSVAGLLGADRPMIRTRPFRSPHHTATAKSLAGGGAYPLPGEITLAHKGILFLDELPEFSRSSLEILRQPLEQGKIYISRVHGNYEFPADFLLAAAMNPCPCGYYPDRTRCSCAPREISRYLGRLSQPLLDRIDICMQVPKLSYEELQEDGSEESTEESGAESTAESTAEIRKRVEKAHQIQKERFRGMAACFNSRLNVRDTEKFCRLGLAEKELLRQAFDRLSLSARAYHRLLRTARTIADLAGEEKVREEHILEALGYRPPERGEWMKEVY